MPWRVAERFLWKSAKSMSVKINATLVMDGDG